MSCGRTGATAEPSRMLLLASQWRAQTLQRPCLPERICTVSRPNWYRGKRSLPQEMYDPVRRPTQSRHNASKVGAAPSVQQAGAKQSATGATPRRRRSWLALLLGIVIGAIMVGGVYLMDEDNRENLGTFLRADDINEGNRADAGMVVRSDGVDEDHRADLGTIPRSEVEEQLLPQDGTGKFVVIVDPPEVATPISSMEPRRLREQRVAETQELAVELGLLSHEERWVLHTHRVDVIHRCGGVAALVDGLRLAVPSYYEQPVLHRWGWGFHPLYWTSYSSGEWQQDTSRRTVRLCGRELIGRAEPCEGDGESTPIRVGPVHRDWPAGWRRATPISAGKSSGQCLRAPGLQARSFGASSPGGRGQKGSAPYKRGASCGGLLVAGGGFEPPTFGL